MATILYVDDEDAMRRALRSLLSRRGHVVHTAGSGAEAREVLLAHDVDGALVDIWLGDESGFDLFEWIDMNRPALAQNLAFVTGDILRDDDMERTLAAFERPVLTKPFDLPELEALVRGWGGPARHES